MYSHGLRVGWVAIYVLSSFYFPSLFPLSPILAAVFNIHLASGAVDPESPYVEALRSAEILQVLSACEDAGHRGEVPIVVGDLNAGN